MYKVLFYKDKNGNEPIKDYLIELSKKAKTIKNDRIKFNKINTYIRALQEYGTRIGNPTVKHIEGDLWELRPLDNRIFISIGKIIPLCCCTILLRKLKKRHQKKSPRQCRI